MGLPLRGMTRKLRFWNRTSSLLGRVVSREGGGGGGKAGGNFGGVAGYVTGDGSYVLAIFFIFFLIVMLTTQLVMMRNEMPNSDGNSHEPGLRLIRGLRVERRQANRVGGLGRTLAALSSGSHHALLADDLTRPNLTTGRWSQKSGVITAGSFSQDQDWVRSMWLCLRKSNSARECPWQPVIEAPDKFYVYSAYFDDYRVNDPLVRIIGVARNKKSDQVWCHLGFASANGTTRWWRVGASVRPIREHWNLRYSAVFVLCSLKGVTGVPDVISVSTTASSVMPKTHLPITAASESFSHFNETYQSWLYTPTGNILPLTHRNRSIARDPDDRWQHQLGICVKPLHYQFNRAQQLIEFIEMHRLLGVTHFTFYNHTVGADVDCILRRYVDMGLIEVLPWQHLDVTSQKEIRTEGIFAALNDCLYRHMFDSRYLLMIDLDEFIIPRGGQAITLPDMLAALYASSIPPTVISRLGAFYFRNAFFYLSWPDDSQFHADSKQQSPDFITLQVCYPIHSNRSKTLTIELSMQKTRRNLKLHPYRIRSKYIVRPRQVVEVGNHFVWEFRPGHSAMHVPDSVAIMHHYRTCEFGGQSCLSNPSVEDRTAWNYKAQLIDAVHNRILHFSAHCQPPIPSH